MALRRVEQSGIGDSYDMTGGERVAAPAGEDPVVRAHRLARLGQLGIDGSEEYLVVGEPLIGGNSVDDNLGGNGADGYQIGVPRIGEGGGVVGEAGRKISDGKDK